MSGGDPQVAVRFVSSATAQLWDAFAKAHEAIVGTGEKLDGTTAASLRADAALKRFADKVRTTSATPIQTLNAEIEKLDRALEKQFLSDAEHAQAKAFFQQRYQEELERSAEAERKAAEARERAQKPEVDPELARFGQQVAERNATAQERYEAAIVRVREAVAAKALTAEMAAREEKRLADELTKSIEKQAAALNEADDELREFAKSIAKVETTPLERLEERLKRLAEVEQKGYLTAEKLNAARKRAHNDYQSELDQSAKKAQKLADAEDRAANSGKIALAEMATATKAAWAGAAVYVTRVLGDMQRQATEAGQAVAQAAPSAGTLAQLVTETTSLESLREKARRVRQLGGANTMEDANRLVFALQSAGAISELESIAKLRSAGIVTRPEEMVKFSAALRTSFGTDTAGTFRDVLNQAIVAAGESPENAEQVLKGASKAAVFAKQNGSTAADLLAGVSIMSSATGSGEEAGSKAAAFFRGVSQFEPERDAKGNLKTPIGESLRGLSTLDIAKRDDLAKLSPADLQKVFGSAEAVAFYGVMRENVDRLEKLTPAIAEARRRDLLGVREQAVARDPELAAAAALVKAQGAAEVSRAALGRANLAAETAQTQLVERVRTTPQGGGRDLAALAFLNPAYLAFRSMRGGADTDSTLVSLGSSALRGIGGDAFFAGLLRRLETLAGRNERVADAQLEAAGALQDAADRLGGDRAVGRFQWSREAARAQAGRAGE